MRALRFLLRYKRRVLLGSVCLVVTTALALSIPWVLGRLVDGLRGGPTVATMPRLAMLMIGLALAQAGMRIVSRYTLFKAARMAECDLRSELFEHMLSLDPAFYRDHATGDVMSRLGNDVAWLRSMWGAGLVALLNTVFMFSVALILMLRMDPRLTLWALVPYPCMFLAGLIWDKRSDRAMREVQAKLGTLSSVVQEDLVGVRVIKAYSLERDRHAKFAAASKILLDKNMAAIWMRVALPPVLGALASLGGVMVIWIGGEAVVAGRMGLGDLVQFSSYLALLVVPTHGLGWLISMFQGAVVAWRRIAELLDARPRIADGDGPPIDPAVVSGSVSIRGLTVEVDGRKLLDGVSLDVPAGSVVAIVGRVGSGKSTLVDAIPRLIDVPKGTVFLDGHDITDLRVADLRRCIGYAPQEAFLFSTTIARNIAVGFERATNGDPGGPDERLELAARAAGLARDIGALPDGYDTMVGEGGITLSGGQRQRVALARAIASSPRVLILDDSLSSVDAETERDILGHLGEMMAGRTAIVISHRLAAVRRADRIAVLDQGRIVETGTHDELIAAHGTYAELYRTQLAEHRS